MRKDNGKMPAHNTDGVNKLVMVFAGFWVIY